MTKLPATSGTTSDDLAQRDMQPILEAKLTSTEKNRNNIMNLTQPVISSKSKQQTTRVTSQQNMFGIAQEDKQMRMIGQKNNTVASVPGGQMLNNFSSGTTQRINPQNQIIPNQKLPIISTRRAHFAVDQRVWDATYIEAQKVNNSYPADL